VKALQGRKLRKEDIREYYDDWFDQKRAKHEAQRVVGATLDSEITADRVEVCCSLISVLFFFLSLFRCVWRCGSSAFP
jgi:hypothetical protein